MCSQSENIILITGITTYPVHHCRTSFLARLHHPLHYFSQHHRRYWHPAWNCHNSPGDLRTRFGGSAVIELLQTYGDVHHVERAGFCVQQFLRAAICWGHPSALLGLEV